MERAYQRSRVDSSESPCLLSRLGTDFHYLIFRIVVLGIGGWTPNPSLKVVFGEPTGTSKKFVEQMSDSVQQYLEDKNVESFNIQDIVLQADGIVQDRVDKLYEQLMSRPEAMEALRAADQIFIATHSQGCIVSTHLLAKLIEQGHCAGSRLMLLALCAISQGPFTYLSNSYTLSPYFNYLESASARELFHYQDPNSESSQLFLISLRTILASGVKITAVGSLNDQVVPLYSALVGLLLFLPLLSTDDSFSVGWNRFCQFYSSYLH